MKVLGVIGVDGNLTNEVYPETFVKLLAAFPFEYVVAEPSSSAGMGI